MDLFNSPKFSARVNHLIDKYHVPGLTAAVVHHDQVASKAFGYITLDPPRPMTTDTLFDIASSSKSLTAASVALLVDDDDRYPDVKWEAEVEKLLPGEFVMPGKGYEGVTVEDILSHRTGLSPNDSSYLGPRSNNTDDAQSITRNIRNLAIAAPIRTKFMYCNIMFTVATYLVEQKTGSLFPDFLEEHFFKPLNMTSTNLQPERARSKGLGDRITPGYCWKKEENRYHKFTVPDAPEGQGAGAIVTSVNDYIKYVKAIMNQEAPFTTSVYNGIVKTRTFMNPEHEDLNPFSSPATYAAGWEVRYYRGHMVVQHDGYVPGSAATHFFLPDFKFGGVMLGNAPSGTSFITEVLTHELIDDLLGLPAEERLDWDEVLDKKYNKDSSKEEDEEEEVRQKLCPGIKEAEPQKMPLSAYVGEYWNPGYQGVKVEIKDNQLFINASDRTFEFYFTFKHLCEQTKYIVRWEDFNDNWNAPIAGEFRFENDIAVKLGIDLESEDLDHYIWFDRVPSTSEVALR